MKLKPYPKYKKINFDCVSSIPTHWKQLPIRAMTQSINFRGRPDLPLLSVYRDYGVIRKDSRDDNHNKDGNDLSTYKLVKPGFLVLNKMKTWQGSLGISKYEGIVSPAYIVCKLLKKVNEDYLNYLLRSPHYINAYNRISYGVRVGQWDMRYDDFKQLQLFLPPIEEQKRIAFFLNTFIGKITHFTRNKQRLIGLLKEQKQAIINRAVTRGLNPGVRLKPSGVPWLGDIPEHWEVWKIGLFAKIGNGSTPSRSNLSYWKDGSYPWLNSSCVNNRIVLSNDQFVTQKALNECHLPIVPANSILIGITGQGKTRGMAALLGMECTINQHLAYITIKKSFMSPNFLHWAIQSGYNELRTISEGTGSTKGALTCNDVGKFKIPVPPLLEQSKIVRFLENKEIEIDNAIVRAEKEIELIQEYRTRLIADVVTGKVDVRDVPIDTTGKWEDETIEQESFDDGETLAGYEEGIDDTDGYQ
jgi:type I restriction enzyme S subunit